jgi:threonine dehydratase
VKGTIILEIVDQIGKDKFNKLDTILVPTGGGNKFKD